MNLDFASQADYFWALLPEIVLSLWAMLVLMVDVFQKGSRTGPSRPMIPWLALAGLGVTLVRWESRAGPTSGRTDRGRLWELLGSPSAVGAVGFAALSGSFGLESRLTYSVICSADESSRMLNL